MLLTTFLSVLPQNTTSSPEEIDNWIFKIATGDKTSLVKLYEDTRVALYGYSLSILKNKEDAEDVLQNIYIKVYSAAVNYTSQGKPMAWLFTIARNLCMMKIRDQKKFLSISEEDWTNTYIADESLSIEDRLLLDAAINSLKDEERQIVILHAVSGFKHREIAGFLNKPLSTILSKYKRALAKLQKILSEERQQ